MKTSQWIGACMFCALSGFLGGKIAGRHDVMTNTVVRLGSPRYVDHKFFGECRRVLHNGDPAADLEACATLRGDE